MPGAELDDGYCQIAYEILPALMTCFGRNEGLIVAIVLIQQWGSPKHPYVTLSPAEIERQCNLPRGNTTRALKKLVAANVLIPDGESGTYFKFNKYSDTWKMDGESNKWIAVHLQLGCTWIKERFGRRSRKRHQQSPASPVTQDQQSPASPVTQDQQPLASPVTQDQQPLASPVTYTYPECASPVTYTPPACTSPVTQANVDATGGKGGEEAPAPACVGRSEDLREEDGRAAETQTRRVCGEAKPQEPIPTAIDPARKKAILKHAFGIE